MPSWISKFLIVAAVFTACWLYALFYWQTNHRVPNGGDIGLYFLAIPLGILLVAWLCVKSWKIIKNKRVLAAMPAATTQSNAQSADKADERERYLTAAILASAAYTQYGQSVDELFSAVQSNALEMELDPTLTNEAGYPILTGRIADLDEEAERELLAEWLREQQLAAANWSAEQVRAIAASSEIIKQLMQEALKHPLLDAYIQASNAKQKAQIILPTLTLHLLYPTHWDEAICNTVLLLFKWLAQEQGWPEDKFKLALYPQQNFAQATHLLDRLMLESHRQSHALFDMLVSCTSYIDEEVMASWPEQLTSFIDKKYHASAIPSEGAAGLLITDLTTAKSFDSSALSTLHRPCLLAIDQNQQLSEVARSTKLAELITHALEVSKVSAENIKFVASDTANQANKLAEVLNIGAEAFPELDPSEHYFTANNQCGLMGATGSLLALAIAHEAFKQTPEQAALFISHMDKHARAVAVISAYNNTEFPENELPKNELPENDLPVIKPA